MPRPLFVSDLEEVLDATASLWSEARGARFFITGGTGFFGCWLLESFLHANRRLDLGAKVTVLTRDPTRFRAKLPHVACVPEVKLMIGDMATLTPGESRFDFALHVATETRAHYAAVDPKVLFQANTVGTERFLALAHASGVRKFLFTSSGAVYGPQPPDVIWLPEISSSAPDPVDPRSAYGESKRVSEMLCALSSTSGACEGKIARCFAFVGPHLPLDANYAIGNFIGDALCGGPLKIGGDGTPKRSYLYAADLAIWLWTLLFRGRSGQAYNVGSDEFHSIKEVAELVRDVISPSARIDVTGVPAVGAAVSRYVPSTAKVRNELNLKTTISLAEAVRRTAAWHRSLVH